MEMSVIEDAHTVLAPLHIGSLKLESGKVSDPHGSVNDQVSFDCLDPFGVFDGDPEHVSRAFDGADRRGSSQFNSGIEAARDKTLN